MADRYEYDRDRSPGREHDYGRERNRMREDERWREGRGDDRGVMDRASDEVRSWFGDDEAARRRERDSRREAREDYGRQDWARNRGFGRDYSTDYDRDIGRGSQYGTERGYARGEDVGRSSRAYSSAGRTYSEPSRDIDRPDWGWGGSEGSQRSWSDRGRQGQSRTGEWGTPRDWESGDREDRMITGGYSSTLLAWSEPGPYKGRGPKGYQRSDDRIREDVCDRLTRHGRIDATDIQIQVRHGEVTLDGIVDTREAKRMAEDVAESVDGVRDVVNHLKTHRGDDPNVAGRTITAKEQKP